jgi:hypothetical protein
VVVTAGCEFYVVVRFSPELDRALMLNLGQHSEGDVPSIPLIEDIAGELLNEDYIWRGGETQQFSLDLTLTEAQGGCFRLLPAGPGLSVIIEDAVSLFPGGAHYYLKNAGSDSLTLKSGAATIGTIAAGETATVLVFATASGNVVEAFT